MALPKDKELIRLLKEKVRAQIALLQVKKRYYESRTKKGDWQSFDDRYVNKKA